jgi:hypothetical protein
LGGFDSGWPSVILRAVVGEWSVIREDGVICPRFLSVPCHSIGNVSGTSLQLSSQQSDWMDNDLDLVFQMDVSLVDGHRVKRLHNIWLNGDDATVYVASRLRD